jgi:hypothetical protein
MHHIQERSSFPLATSQRFFRRPQSAAPASRAKRFGFIAAGILMGFCACAQDIHVEGKIVYTAFSTNDAVMATMTRGFTLDVSGDKWLAHSEGLAGIGSVRERWCEEGGDGTNLYCLRSYKPPANLSANQLARYTPGMGSIRQATIPITDISFTAPIWFAYVKSASMQRPGKFKPLLYWSDDEEMFYSPKVGYEILVQTNREEPYLPKKAYFIDFGWDFIRLYGKVVPVKSFRKPYTNAIFSASNFVAVGSLSVPMSFVFEGYAPNESQGGAPYRDLRLQVTASSASPQVARKQFSPEITDRTLVTDFRFPIKSDNEDEDVPYLHYSITNAWPISTNDLLIRAAISKNSRTVPRGKRE